MMRVRNYFAAAMVLSGSVACVEAAPVFVDFGPTAAAGTETGPAGVSGTWQNPWGSTTSNLTGTVQTLSGGETIQLTRGNNDTSLDLTWADNKPAAGTATAPAGSVMAGQAGVYSDYIRSGDTGRTLGVRLSGFAPGTYDVYLVINDWSNEVGSRVALGVLENEAGNGPFTVGSLAQPVTALLTDSDRALTTWTASSTSGNAYNYVKATVTLDESNDYIVAFMESARGTGTSGAMGIHSIQIVVPEPASMALVGVLAPALLVRRRTSGR